MAINKVQMQRGVSLSEFMARYGSEAQCEEALVALRWPEGFCCSACGHRQASTFRRGGLPYWQCCACRKQTSLTAGTMLQGTRLPLTKWFLAIYLMTQSKTQIAALALMRHLDISWKAAWLLKHKLMEAMFQREQTLPLRGIVSVDDAYLGGERAGGKRGRGSENKVPFVAAVEMHKGQPVRVRFDRVRAFSFKALRAWHAVALAPGTQVTSDGLIGFEVLQRDNFAHQTVQPPPGKAGTEVEPFRWLNTVLGNLKTALSGTHHAFAFGKYGHRYLADAQYRFNRRYRLAELPTRLAVALLQAKPRSAWDLRIPAEAWT
ncbi:IS1595 family transposase [Algiphilus sp. NNCM1]|nr:IS1595 family transposase [Algiphilus acroporae]